MAIRSSKFRVVCDDKVVISAHSSLQEAEKAVTRLRHTMKLYRFSKLTIKEPDYVPRQESNYASF